MSLSFYLKGFGIIKLNRYINIPEEDQDKYFLTNAIVSVLLSPFFCIALFYLLGEQLKNVFSNTTAFERSKSIRKSSSSIMTANSVDRGSLNEVLTDDGEENI